MNKGGTRTKEDAAEPLKNTSITQPPACKPDIIVEPKIFVFLMEIR
jgi:hypothetical protein